VELADPGGVWTRTIWVPFSPYLEDMADPRLVELPARQTDDPDNVTLIYSRARRDLPGPVALEEMKAIFFPGRQRVNDWHSHFRVQLPDGQVRPSMVRLNHTATFGPWTLFQASEAPDHESFSVLGVGNRPGVGGMLIACGLVTAGMLYAFYVKPILKRRRLRGAPLMSGGAS
jgi:hypothetical protein